MQLFVVSYHVDAQANWKVISTGGGRQTAGAVVVHFTVGQLANTSTTTSKSGFQFKFDPSVVAVSDLKPFEMNFDVYPNPASSYINIDVTKILEATLILHDALGNIVEQRPFHGKHLELLLSEIPRGQYYISIINATHYFTKSIQIL